MADLTTSPINLVPSHILDQIEQLIRRGTEFLVFVPCTFTSLHLEWEFRGPQGSDTVPLEEVPVEKRRLYYDRVLSILNLALMTCARDLTQDVSNWASIAQSLVYLGSVYDFVALTATTLSSADPGDICTGIEGLLKNVQRSNYGDHQVHGKYSTLSRLLDSLELGNDVQ